MIPRLSDDLRQALSEHGGAPVYVVDDATNASYVILPAEQYESMKAAAGDDGPEALYPLLAEIDPEDWEDASQYGIGPS
jgi:hypothetical protein